MKLTSIAINPPQGTESRPKLSPELLASVLARFSRSNEGISAILDKIDTGNPEASIEKIFKFVDFGHASIGGLTGSIVMAIEDVSMWMAFKLFEFSPYGAGMECSTRYIEMNEANLLDPGELGFTRDDANTVRNFGQIALSTYKAEYARLDKYAADHPDVIKFPANASEAAKKRIRKNYALDRCRYFLPLTLKTNVGLMQSAQAWTETIALLSSLPQPEAQELAQKLRAEVAVYAPRLIRHAHPKAGCIDANNEEIADALRLLNVTHRYFPAQTDVVCAVGPTFKEDMAHRANHYDRAGWRTRKTPIEVTWDGMTIAEARDINRHRTGHRLFFPTHRGFYLPIEVIDGMDGHLLAGFTQSHQTVLNLGASATAGGVQGSLLPYTLALGSQGVFYRTTMLNHFVYEAELRTGHGAHFRYAEHYRDAVDALERKMPHALRGQIRLGNAEPE